MTSTSVTGSASNALTSMFNALATTANVVSKTITTSADALEMANSYVTTAREKQIVRTEMEMHTYYTACAEEFAIENSRRQATLQQELAKDTNLHKLFGENYEAMLEIAKNCKSQRNNRLGNISE